jgi:hypothetical protein
MADRVKKPKNYRRGHDLSRATTTPTRTEVCTANFPCLVNIHVLAGLEQPCAPCAPEVQKMRDLHGYRQEGKFWLCDDLTEDQQQLIRHRIGQADIRNWVNKEEE